MSDRSIEDGGVRRGQETAAALSKAFERKYGLASGQFREQHAASDLVQPRTAPQPASMIANTARGPTHLR